MKFFYFFMVSLIMLGCSSDRRHHALVFQSDFGLKDGAVSAMKGVAKTVDPELGLYDITHEIPPFDIWEAAYRLHQTVSYWPAGTVFVSVVDPGVGTNRNSVVALLKSGQYVVTPENGTLTLLHEEPGIVAIRQIDEKINRRAGSAASYTFHGRDVYAYVGARLASGKIYFEEVGPEIKTEPVILEHRRASVTNGIAQGAIPAFDPAYGNVWTNISDSLVGILPAKPGDTLNVRIEFQDSVVYSGRLPYVLTFGQVAPGQPLIYLNSLLDLSLAINQGDFASTYGVGKGPGWTVYVSREK